MIDNYVIMLYGVRILNPYTFEMESYMRAGAGGCSMRGYSCWDKIDAVVCINLDECTEKWERWRQRFLEFLPAEKIHRISAIRGVGLPGYGESPWFTARTGNRASYWGSGAGCLLSHRNALRYAKEQGWRNVLIFEDDAVPELSEDGLKMLDRTLDGLRGKWLLFLGYSAKPQPKGRVLARENGASLWQIGGVLTTHAYIVPECMYEELLAAMPEDDTMVWAWMAWHRALDNFYRSEVSEWRGVKTYAILPQMFYQELFYEVYARKHGIDCSKELKLSDSWECPNSQCGLFGVFHRVFSPLRRGLNFCNSLRRYLVSRLVGFRGSRKGR